MSDQPFDPEAFQRALRGMATAAPDPVDDDRWAYREAAAVRGTFDDFAVLRPVRRVRTGTAPERVLRIDCHLIPTDSGALWTLDDDVRDAALRHLGSAPTIARAIELNDAPGDALQHQLTRLVDGSGLDLGELSFGDLLHVRRLTASLRGVVDDLPDEGDVEQRLAVADLLAPLQSMTDEGFHGRADVLARLNEHVFGQRKARDALKLESLTQSFTLGPSQLWFTLRDRSRPPLLLHGPGGSGKSTVIARFVLDHVAVDRPQLLIAHIDFDRPRFAAEEPLTLLGEILRQVCVQVPELTDRSAELRTLIQARLSRKELEPSASALDAPRTVVAFTDREQYVEDFGSLMADELANGRLLVLVLDTLEEVQYRGQDYIEELWYFLGQLHAAVPALRVVAAGRVPLTGVTADPERIGDLDDESARAFLSARLDGLGVDTGELGGDIVERVGRNPLTLKLAADVVRDAGKEALADALGKKQVHRSIETEVVQGVLYRRILDHLHDEPVKQLALPGLALRRLTPDVIRHVLAPAGGLEVADDAQATDLFDRFAREVALVELDREGTLRYRNDVRRLALRLVETDSGVPLRRVHSRAVDYFAKRDDHESRGDEIYHRLRLDQRREQLDPRWLPELSEMLGSALDDFGGWQYAWLATKLGLTLSSAELEDADQEDWETHAERRARYYVELEDPRRALKLLRERKARLRASRLPVLETVALEQLGRYKDASKLLGKAAKAAHESGDDRLNMEVAMASARVKHHLEDDLAARNHLNVAVTVGHKIGDPLLELQVLLTAAELGLVTAELSAALEPILARIPPGEFADEPQLLSAAAGEFGEAVPSVLRLALETVGLPGLRVVEEIKPLAAALEQLTGYPHEHWQQDLLRNRRRPDAAAELLRHVELEPPLTGALAGIYRARALRAKRQKRKGEAGGHDGASPVPIWANPRTRRRERS